MTALLLAAVVAAGQAPAPAQAQAPQVRITLEEAEKAAVRTSPSLKALGAEAEAAMELARGRYSRLWPALSADASWRYIGTIPELSVLNRTMAMGAHENYSIGPTLGWTVWDQGRLSHAWRSAQAQARSKEEERRDQERQLVLRVRAAYFQAQLGLEQVRVLADSLRLAQSQYKDIESRRKAGAASVIDSLSAHQEVLARQRSFRQARTDLAGALRDLVALMGAEPPADLALPASVEPAPPGTPLPPGARAVWVQMAVPEGTEPASVVAVLDPIDESLRRLEPAGAAPFDESHPALLRWAETASAYRRASRSARAGLWPRVLLTARTSLDYPNGPVVESFRQDTVGASLSLPLFELGRTRREASQAERLAEAADSRAGQVRSDRLRDWLKARDRLLGLRAQARIDQVSVRETRELSQRIYESYRAGRSTFLEVQSSNLRELEAKVQEARTRTQMLLELAALSELSGKESRP